MRDQQLTRGLRAIAILGFFALLSSISRAFSVGWHSVMYLHIGIYLVVLATALLNRRLSFFLKATIITSIAFLLGVAGLIAWGLAAFSMMALFCFCILATMLFGSRAGILASIFCIVTIGIAGACAHAGMLTFKFNAEIYLSSLATWVTAMFAMALSAGIIVVALGTLDQQIVDLIHALERRNNELLETNRLLKNEITEHRRVEEERRKLEDKLELAKKMETLGTLAGGVAHDLNNVLGSIVGYPDLLLIDLPQDSPLREPLEAIKTTGIKAAAIVYDLLTLTRRGVVTTKVVNLNSVVTEYFASLEFKKLKTFHPQVEVEFKQEPGLLNILGSPVQLSKMVMNLVSNAAEAMPNGGKISVSLDFHGNRKG